MKDEEKKETIDKNGDTLTESQGHMGGHKFSHPSMGIIALHRVSCSGAGGGATLFGSEARHPQFLQMTVYQGSVERELSTDWHHQEKPLMEINLTAAQFSDLLLSLNDGDGIPCTIGWSYGKKHELPDLPTKVDQFREETKAMLDAGVTGLKDAYAEVEELLKSGKPINKTQLKALSSKIMKLQGVVDRGMPFIMERFGEQLDKMVTGAKCDVDAFIQTAVMKTGIDTLKAQVPTLLADQKEDE
jgi:hypothetical protein